MSKYLKEVHLCDMPERRPNDGDGTIWQCDCGFMWELLLWPEYIGQRPKWNWTPLEKGRYNKDTGEIMTRAQWATHRLEQFAKLQEMKPKRWWQK